MNVGGTICSLSNDADMIASSFVVVVDLNTDVAVVVDNSAPNEGVAVDWDASGNKTEGVLDVAVPVGMNDGVDCSEVRDNFVLSGSKKGGRNSMVEPSVVDTGDTIEVSSGVGSNFSAEIASRAGKND